jgi:hypothetical protein
MVDLFLEDIERVIATMKPPRPRLRLPTPTDIAEWASCYNYNNAGSKFAIAALRFIYF